ncbi:NADP-dependent oxidoreductase [Nocardia sp. NPDC004750]
MSNRQFRLANRPVGAAQESDWEQVTEPIPSVGEGQFLIQVLQLSLDPAMRGWMNAGKSYIPPVEIGAVMRAYGTGRVLESRHSDFRTGDLVTGEFGVQEFAVSSGRGVQRIDPDLPVPLSTHLGVLGLTGMTAYFGLLEVGGFAPGQTVVVSGAAGGVGSTVGQIAKILGGRVVGIAGGPDKCRFLVEDLGFDAAIDYKTENVRHALRDRVPGGADVFFDNVGGSILDAGLLRLAQGARVVICGAISQYNSKSGAQGPDHYLSLLVARARMEGFVVYDYEDRFPRATRALAQWLADGRLDSVQDVVPDSILAFPKLLAGLFAGQNTGKLVLDLQDRS